MLVQYKEYCIELKKIEAMKMDHLLMTNTDKEFIIAGNFYLNSVENTLKYLQNFAYKTILALS